MRIADEFEKTGQFLFKYRGSFPLLILPLVVFALIQPEYFERTFGSTAQIVWEVFCISLSFLGLFIRILTLGWVPEGTSGRNTGQQLASSLNTKGMYSIVRHPLYLANFFITFGMILFVQVWWLVLLFILFFWLFYERIMFTEEAFLEKKFGSVYADWAQQTPAFIPDLRKWQKPTTPFSFKMILKREYSTFFGIIVAFIALDFLIELFSERQFEFRWQWLLFFGIGLTVYLVFRTLRKKTHFLEPKRKE